MSRLSAAQQQAPGAVAADLHIAQPGIAQPGIAESGIAESGIGAREFACLACVTHLRPGDARQLRRLAGVTAVIDEEDAADLHLIVLASSRRAAGRDVASRITDALPHTVVTVPEVVDYDAALLSFLECHGDERDGPWAFFDDCAATHAALDRE